MLAFLGGDSERGVGTGGRRCICGVGGQRRITVSHELSSISSAFSELQHPIVRRILHDDLVDEDLSLLTLPVDSSDDLALKLFRPYRVERDEDGSSEQVEASSTDVRDEHDS